MPKDGPPIIPNSKNKKKRKASPGRSNSSQMSIGQQPMVINSDDEEDDKSSKKQKPNSNPNKPLARSASSLSDEEEFFTSSPIQKKQKKFEVPTGIYPNCEFHPRLQGSSTYTMKEKKHWNTYSRSDGSRKHKTYGKRNPKINSYYAKAGTYQNPYAFDKAHQDLFKLQANSSSNVEQQPVKAEMYDAYLAYRVNICNYIISEVKKQNQKVVLNADYDYPCVLVETAGGASKDEIKDKKKRENNQKYWTGLACAYFVGVANYSAWKKGMPIEIVMRSSFGHYLPSVAECVESYRINVGIIPKEYADILVQTILKIHRWFDSKIKEILEKKEVSESFTKVAKKYNKMSNERYEANTNENKREPQKVTDADNMWGWLWGNGDSSGKTVLAQIVDRQQIQLEAIANEVHSALLKTPNCIPTNYLCSLAEQFTINKTSISIEEPTDFDSELKSFTYFFSDAPPAIIDKAFWKHLDLFLIRLGASQEERSGIKGTYTAGRLYAKLDELHLRFIKERASQFACDDGPGSDSETEGVVQVKSKRQKVYSKKLITATGMRAIHLAYYCAKLYAAKKGWKLESPKANHMYYETPEALKNINIQLTGKETIADVDELESKTIAFFDLNHCNSAQATVLTLNFSNIDILVLDHTSAQTTLIKQKVAEALSDGVALLLLVNSGLKNEQGGADHNSYGTLRIMTMEKTMTDALYTEVIKLDELDRYKHPKQSHAIRKAYKQYTFVPVTRNFFTGEQ